ncbi:MAG: 50S ribosomal protein L13 [Candidatus Levybacteria bacterium]|nr:50S ribosomal protein L13 [Candidatus Levybacteria bacterium]
MQQMTQPTTLKTVKREWHLVDVKDQTLGRIASKIAQYLMGKNKPYFVRNLDCGDYVIVTNAKEIKITGKKEQQKVYYRYSGYPGGLTIESYDKMKARDPRFIIMHAVKGMLPQNRLRDKMLRRLKVFVGPEHRFAEKLKTKSDA